MLTFLENAEKLFEWITNNHMNTNHDKCHLLKSTLTPISIKVTGDANLYLNCHSENILKKASKKVHMSVRVTLYMSIPKRKLSIPI